MKKLALGLITLFSISAFAQGGTQAAGFTELQGKLIDVEQQRASYGLNDLELSKMEGSPYAKSTFSVGNIYKGDKLIKKTVLLRYNALSKQIEMKNNNIKSDDEYGSLVKALDIYATIEGKTYKLIPFENSVANGDYYEVMTKGKTYDLFKKTNVKFINAYTAKTSYEKDKPAKFVQEYVYYLSTKEDGKLIELPSSKRKLIKFLGEKDKGVKDFIKSNNIDSDDDKDLVKLIQRYDNLF